MLNLVLTAEMEGVTNLCPVDTEENPFYYMFKVQCTSCREVHPTWIGVNRFEQREIHGSRGEANLVWRCKNCQRESSAIIKSEPTPYAISQPPKPQTILTFECRGCEFVDFKPEGAWTIEAAPATEEEEDEGIKIKANKWDEVEIEGFVEGKNGNGGEWFEYDDKNEREVSVKVLKWEIRR